MQETWVRSLGWKDALEKGTATHSSILVCRIPWTIESMGSQKVGHDWTTLTSLQDTARPTHRTKDWAELAGCGPAHPSPETGRRGQPETEGGNHSPREASSTKLQEGFIANQDFLGFWMVNICWEGHSQRSGPQKRHTAHLRRCTGCTPRKPSVRDKGGNNSQRPHSPSTWSHELLGPGKGTKCRPNWVCTFVEYPTTWTWVAKTWKVHTTQGQPQTVPGRATQSLSSADRESTHTVNRDKPSLAKTLWAHTSVICWQCSSLPTALLNKWA